MYMMKSTDPSEELAIRASSALNELLSGKHLYHTILTI
jgi:hypothetical protein